MSQTNIRRPSLSPINLHKTNKDKILNQTFFPLISDNMNQTISYPNNNNNSLLHPLEFYSLGKIYNNNKKISPFLQYNNGIKSTSNNIIERNALSINTTKYNKINVHKIISNINQQNKSENNYLQPVAIFKTLEKYNIPKTATNFEVYRIMKEKLFSQDVESNISKGKLISNEEYLKEKYQNKNKDMNKKEEKQEKKIHVMKNILEDKKNNTISGFFYKDPNDYTKKLLRNNTFCFEQNNIQMIKPKKWKKEIKS